MQKYLSKLPENLRQLLGKFLFEAVYDANASRHRRIITLAVDTHKKFAYSAYLILAFHSIVEGKKRVLYAYEDRESSYWRFMRVIKRHRPRKIYIKTIPIGRSRTVLGETFDAAVIDLTFSLFPNDLGILVDTVRGGGIIFILLDSPASWLEKTMKQHFELASYPYTERDTKRTFERYFLHSLKTSPGIYFVSETEAIANRVKGKSQERQKITIPERMTFDKRIYRLCATQDQVDVLEKLEKYYFSGDGTFVVTANRGRGKSAVVGLFLGALAHHLNFGRFRVGVTAPSFEGAKTIFEFAKLAMTTLGEPPKFDGKVLKRKKFEMVYHTPMDMVYQNVDMVVVDEASGLPVPMLHKLLNVAEKSIFSTTIHGYEGAGRGFNIRFLRKLKEDGINVQIFELNEPIRYSANDPIEKWLYDVLLLDAEPERIDELNFKRQEFIEFDRVKLFLEDRETLRKYIGIYILAHYRNEPNDIIILADAPHIHAASLKLDQKLASSLLLAEEGNLPEEICEGLTQNPELHQEINGHVIPSVLARYYEDARFPCFKGLRVVRIAAHPSFFNQGIGSASLKKMEEFYSGRFDWFGASFGATPELLNFWFRNGYYPVYISPVRNAVSGEYSVAYVKAHNHEVSDFIERFNTLLVRRIIKLKDTNYRDMETELFLRLIRQRISRITERRNISDDEVERVKLFRREVIPWGYVRDIARKLAQLYFLNLDIELSEMDEVLILENFLHLKELGEIAAERGWNYKTIVIRSHELFNLLFDHYYPGLVPPRKFRESAD